MILQASARDLELNLVSRPRNETREPCKSLGALTIFDAGSCAHASKCPQAEHLSALYPKARVLTAYGSALE